MGLSRSLQIPKLTDDAIVEIANRLVDGNRTIVDAAFTIRGGGSSRDDVAVVPKDCSDLLSDASLADIVQHKVTVFDIIRIEFTGGQKLQINRKADSLIEDGLSVSSSDNDGPKFARFCAAVLSAVGAQPVSGNASELIGEPAKTILRAHEQLLGRLQKLQGEMLHDLEHARRELATKTAEEREVAERELDEKDKRLTRKLDERKEQLDKREEQLDLSESKAARRKIYSELSQRFSSKFDEMVKVTEATEAKRHPVNRLLNGLLLALVAIQVALLGVEFYQAFNGTESFDTVFWIRQGVLAGALAAICVTYYRWSSSWFDRNAQIEHQLKRLELDFVRASWVVELALQWHADTGEPINDELLARLSAGLFSEGKPFQSPRHPADDLATMLFGRSSELSVEGPGVGFKFGRRDKDKLLKDVEKMQQPTPDGEN